MSLAGEGLFGRASRASCFSSRNEPAPSASWNVPSMVSPAISPSNTPIRGTSNRTEWPSSIPISDTGAPIGAVPQ